jgi:hypothetical protein
MKSLSCNSFPRQKNLNFSGETPLDYFGGRLSIHDCFSSAIEIKLDIFERLMSPFVDLILIVYTKKVSVMYNLHLFFFLLATLSFTKFHFINRVHNFQVR